MNKDKTEHKVLCNMDIISIISILIDDVSKFDCDEEEKDWYISKLLYGLIDLKRKDGNLTKGLINAIDKYLN